MLSDLEKTELYFKQYRQEVWAHEQTRKTLRKANWQLTRQLDIERTEKKNLLEQLDNCVGAFVMKNHKNL